MSVHSVAFGGIIIQMLKVISYQDILGLTQVLKAEIGLESALIVTPNPSKADSLRVKWSHLGRLDAVTFSKFSSDLSKKLNPNEEKVAWRKSRLLLQLNAFKNVLPQGKNLSYSEFKTAYQIFSDLRAYVPAQDFPDEILENFDDDIALVAQLFHQAARSLDILDEHTGTQYLAEELRKPEALSLETRVIVFEGFSFLTPVQISLVESLGIRHKVLIPIPSLVLASAHPFDWVSIVKDSSDELLSVGVEVPQANLKIASYASGSLLITLKNKFAQSQEETQIVLSAKSLSPIIEQEVPTEYYQKKMAVDLLAEERDTIFSRLEKICLSERKLRNAMDLLVIIDEEVIKEKKSLTIETGKTLAVYQLIRNACTAIPEVLANQEMNHFFFQLLREVTALDSPRNNLISFSLNKSHIDLLTIKDIHLLDAEKKILFCIDSRYGKIQSDSRAFSPKLEKELAKLGPVRRPELEFLFLEASLRELWSHPQLEILVEEGILEHDLGWKKIFHGSYEQMQTINTPSPATKPDFSFFMSEEHQHSTALISASRLQDFIDCPKKYHASRLAKITPLIKQISEVDVMNLGTLEHELIQIGWERGEKWWSDIKNLENQAKELIATKFGFTNLNPIALAGAAYEASLYSLNGIEYLKMICSQLDTPEVHFAVDIDKTTGRQGEIDCIIKTPSLDLILDFKRSKGQNPSLGQFRSAFSKIQLWFYLNSIELSPTKDYGVGYLFLKDIQESWIICSGAGKERLLEHFPKRVDEWRDFHEQLKSYQDFETSVLLRWRAERAFLPNPSSSKICTFCDLSSICTKSSIEEDEE